MFHKHIIKTLSITNKGGGDFMFTFLFLVIKTFYIVHSTMNLTS